MLKEKGYNKIITVDPNPGNDVADLLGVKDSIRSRQYLENYLPETEDDELNQSLEFGGRYLCDGYPTYVPDFFTHASHQNLNGGPGSTSFAQKYTEIWNAAELILGYHPDEATVPLFLAAEEEGKNF